MAGARASTPARPTGSPTVDPQGDTLEQINRGADNDHWASEGWSGRLVTLSGNESLVLDLSHVAYEIHSGRVAVFYSEQLGGKGWGRRVPICSCSRGDLIGPGIGGAIPAGPEVRRAALELVALDEVQLLRRSIPDGPEPLDEEDLPALGLERWISRVAPRIAECRGDEQLLDLELRSGFTVLAGESFCHREDGLRWVRVDRGRLRLGSADGRWLGPDSAPLPLPPRFPLWAHEDCEISFEESLPATTGELLGGLGWIHGALMDAEHARIARQVVAERRRLEQADFVEWESTEEAYSELARPIVSHVAAIRRTHSPLQGLLGKICAYMGLPFDGLHGLDEDADGETELERLCSTNRLRFRRVSLRGEWWRQDGGPLLGWQGESEEAVALLPDGEGRYRLYGPDQPAGRAVGPDEAATLGESAFSFVPVFADSVRDLPSLGLFALSRCWRELPWVALVVGFITLLSTVPAFLTAQIVDDAIPAGSRSMLMQLGLGLALCAIAGTAFSICKALLTVRLQTLLTSGLQMATIDRLLGLGSRFFQSYSSGDLLKRAMMVTEVGGSISGVVMGSILSICTALFTLAVMFHYGGSMAWIGVGVALLSAITSSVVAVQIRKCVLELELLGGKLFGFLVQLVQGVAKLHAGGARQRAFNAWASRFAEITRLSARAESWSMVSQMAESMIAPLGTVLVYYAFGSQNGALGMGSFLGFLAAFGAFNGAVEAVAGNVVGLSEIWARRGLIEPILTARPEVCAGRRHPGRLEGGVSMRAVRFRYSENGAPVVEGINLEVRPGEMVALVGPSGGGKSTLLKLMLGLEVPEEGAVLYDGRDLAGLDVRAVRRQLGVVLQRGSLSAGSIFENVCGGAPLTPDEVMAALRDAGFESDLSTMPMGLHTVVSEGGSNLSGGQRQRLLIARALARNPRIMLLDEATSALDNRTQRIVSESIARRRVTRVVIAHRLSTIASADRVYVVDGGRIVQSGTMRELEKQPGLFRTLMERQLT